MAASDGYSSNHRMFVLKSTSDNPRAPYEMVGQITDPTNKWAIDGTVMELNGELYFPWSGWEGRSVWISPVTFDENGKPDFGKPETTVRFPVAVQP